MTDHRMQYATSDTSTFPDPVYQDTVLKPLFDRARKYFVADLGKIDRAHLVMLAETGILSHDQAADIANALVAIEQDIDPAEQSYTGEVEDFFFLIEKELKQRLGADLGGRLHTARSRNDIDHTLFKLNLRQKTDRFIEKSITLLESMIVTAERERATLIVAYTHGQPAQPTTFGHYLGAAIEVLSRDIERVFAARRIIDLCPMGAAAITTSGFATDRSRIAELLGFAAPLGNSYGCIAAVDYITATYSALELMFLHLGRLIQDFQFWSSFEVGQLYVPNALVQISSIMPQKRNPVPIEHMRHLASQASGQAETVLRILHNTPFTDINDSESETQILGYQAFDSGFRVLDLIAGFIAQVSIDSARVAANIERSCITITELADSLVRRENLSFRQAHEITAEVARTVVAHGGTLVGDGYEPLCRAFLSQTGREIGLDKAAFRALVSPEHFVAVRQRFGGPGEPALSEALVSYRRQLAVFKNQAAAAEDALRHAANELSTSFNRLTGKG